MSGFEEGIDFDSLEREIDIDRKVRLGRLMLEINESISALTEQLSKCSQVVAELDKWLDCLDTPNSP